MDDETIRNIFLGALCLLSIGFCAGGFLYRVQGAWSDGARRIILAQFGPFVWGESHFETGFQRFSGRMAFGHLKLNRRDYGDAHLQSLGFTRAHLSAMQGAQTGFFKLRLTPEGALEGLFFGRTFSARQNKMVPTSLAEAAPRIWQRSA